MLLSAPLATAADASQFTFANGHFRRADGTLFVPLGGFYANLMPRLDGETLGELTPFQKLSEAEWRAWFALLQAHGCNALRLFCRLHDEQDGVPVEWTLDAGGHVNPEVLATFERCFAVAQEYGISFLMTVLSEPRGSIYSHWAPIVRAHPLYAPNGWPWNSFVPEDPNQRRLLPSHAAYFTDPEAVALQKQYLAELMGRLRGNPAVFAVELYNEMAWDGQFRWAEQDLEIAWANEMIGVIRQNAPGLPVCFSLAGHGITGIDPLKWCTQIRADFFSSHFYPTISGESPELDYGAMAALVHDYCAAAMPNWPGEAGVLDAAVPDELRRLALRDHIWLTLTSGGAGYLQWPLDRQPVAHLEEYREAAEFVRGAPWLAGDLAPAQATVDIRALAAFLGQSEDREARIASPLFDALRRYERLALDRGLTLGLRLGEADVDGSRFDPLALAGRRSWLSVPQGYQMRCLATATLDAGLAYCRNHQRAQLGAYELRRGAERAFGFRTALPPGRYRFTVLDLDRDTTETVEANSPGVVLPPRVTSSDFAVRFERQ